MALPVRPAQVRKLGLSVVHQDLGLIDAFSVLENLRVGLFGVNRLTRAIRWRAERELARATLAALGAELDLGAPVGELSAAQRATVAIARAMQQQEPGQGVIMFDESTRALPPEPRRHFHELVRELVGRGGSALLVSHQLEEVLAHTDRVTVLRDGQVVASGVPTAWLSERELIRLMLGRERIGHSGHKRLRTALYMATLSAARCNPLIKAFYERLRAAGKPPKVARCAAARKLLQVAWAVVRHQRAFDPHDQPVHLARVHYHFDVEQCSVGAKRLRQLANLEPRGCASRGRGICPVFHLAEHSPFHGPMQ